jgi:hypothetical protein
MYLTVPQFLPNISNNISTTLNFSIVAFLLFSFYIKNIMKEESLDEINNRVGRIKQDTIKSKNDEKIFNLELSFPKGTKIILLSNEPNTDNSNFNELKIGYVSHIECITKANNPVVVYGKELNSDELFFTMSEPLYHTDELEANLLKLKWNERWNIFSRGTHIIDNKEALRKEKYSA